MMEQNYYLYLGQDKKEFFSLPETWTVSHFVEATVAIFPSGGLIVPITAWER
jgi:hypothetical protein